MYKISKQFEFCASHALTGLATDHPCMRCHGHNYKVKIVFKGDKLNEAGMLLDYREMQGIKSYLDEVWDHTHLNNILLENPTAENIARFLYHQIPHHIPSNIEVDSVEVSETDKTNAIYYE